MKEIYVAGRLPGKAHIHRLERLITEGEALRDNMRRSAEAKDAIIRRQAGELKNTQHLNEIFRERRNRAAIRLGEARQEISKLKGKLAKTERRYADQELFYQAVKSAANEMGVWAEIIARVKGKA